MRKRHKTLENKNRKFPIFLKSSSSSPSFIFTLVVETFFPKKKKKIGEPGAEEEEDKKKAFGKIVTRGVCVCVIMPSSFTFGEKGGIQPKHTTYASVVFICL